ncbi:MAG: type II toxin-antitoxin system RelE/ParE family toxin [bacterium]
MYFQIKPVEFLGPSLEDLRAFPQLARREAGFQIDRVQCGREVSDWKPMTTVGPGVREIRVRDATGAYRVIYIARFEEAVYVLHCFQKKTQKTSVRDMELSRSRYNELLEKRRRSRK